MFFSSRYVRIEKPNNWKLEKTKPSLSLTLSTETQNKAEKNQKNSIFLFCCLNNMVEVKYLQILSF